MQAEITTQSFFMLRENAIPFPSFPNILLSHNLHGERFPKSGLLKASGKWRQRFYLPSNIYLLFALLMRQRGKQFSTVEVVSVNDLDYLKKTR